MRKNKKMIQVILAVIAAWIMLGIGILIGIKIDKDRYNPVAVITTQKSWTITRGEEGDLVEDNFWRFARMSYILVGDYPDYQFYKIVSEVPRNDFDAENFYIEDGTDKMYYHDDQGNRTSSIVIDVSTFQTYIDWEAVKSAGVNMAIIRVAYRGYGTGRILEDDLFRDHIEGALDAGLKVGVYFFSQAINYAEGVEEAQFTLDIIREYDVQGPVVIDTEYVYADDTRTENLGVDERTDGIVGFCETVKAAGYEPMIYASRNWFAQALDMTRLGDYKLWLAFYSNSFAFPYEIAGWQYTGNGTIDGINGDVDLNVWFDE